MNEFIFKIPLKLEELTLVTNDVQRFVVSQEYSQREKTWLLTQQWMIDNINRLHHELNELARDYNQHVERSREEQSQKEAEFVRDITSLRADHSVIEQHQQQILDYIKVNSKNNNINNIDNNNQISSQIERMISLKPAYYKIAASKSLKKRRHLLSNLLKREKQFEDEAKLLVKSKMFTFQLMTSKSLCLNKHFFVTTRSQL